MFSPVGKYIVIMVTSETTGVGRPKPWIRTYLLSFFLAQPRGLAPKVGSDSIS